MTTNLAKYFAFAVFSLSPLSHITAQTDGGDWEETYQTLDNPEEEEAEEWEMSYEELCELAEHKIDINSAGKEDLLRLPFISEQQVMDIMEYLYHYGSMKTANELLMIESIDYKTQQMLLKYIVFGNTDGKKRFPSAEYISKYGKNTLLADVRMPLYEHKGDKWGYLGYNVKHWLRYEFTCGKWIRAGVMMAQDAGEPFFAGNNKQGYDYMSPYIIIKGLGRLKTLAVGRYKARFGMGLALNNSFSMGKQASSASVGRVSEGLYAHASRQEGNYMQGAGATMEIMRNMELTTFVSYRKIDTTLNNEDNSIATILKNGYHRTASEMLRKHNASQTVVGGNANYSISGFHFGITGYHTAFDKPLHPDTAKLYKLIAPWGKSFWNISGDYGYTNHQIAIKGELATNDNGGLATINSISYAADNHLSVVAIQRFYSYRYYSVMGSAFSEGRSIQNESGIYIGTTWYPTGRITFANYIDWAYFPWPKYLVTGSSHTFDMQHSATWAAKHWETTVRYRLKTYNKDCNNADGSKYLGRITHHRFRISTTHRGRQTFARTQADVSLSGRHHTSSGYSVSQQFGMKTGKWQIYCALAYFNTDGYDSRIYIYERSTPYSISFPLLYGHGTRLAATARFDMSHSLMAMTKIGSTWHFDDNGKGSGYQQTSTKKPTDIDMMLCWKF